MTTRISDQSPRMSMPDDLTSHGPDEPRESRVDAPATPATTEELSARVKVAARETWQAKHTLAFVNRQSDPAEARPASAIGACKTVVSSTVAAYAAAAGVAVFKNPMAGVATGLVGKIAGDGVAWLACESPEAK